MFYVIDTNLNIRFRTIYFKFIQVTHSRLADYSTDMMKNQKYRTNFWKFKKLFTAIDIDIVENAI